MAVYFERSTYSGAEPITLSEAKAFLRVDSSDDDSYITELITMTRDFIEKETNTALVSNTYTEYRNGFPSKDNGVITLQINGDLTIGSLTPQVAFLKDGVWTNLHDGTELIKNGEFEDGEEELTDGGLDITTVSSYNTGKALSFDGVNDYVDCGNTGVSLKTLAFLIHLDSTTENVLQLTSTQSVEVSSGTITLNGTWTGSTIYVDATATSTIADSNWKRVVITTTSAITVDDLELGRIGSSYGDFILSDLQIYDTAWTQADVTYDYDNPQNLVTDRAASTIALSNLKGYWHLSEGDGDYAYNSAVALGSEEVTDGDFPSGTTAWSFIGGSVLTSDGARINNTVTGSNSYALQTLIGSLSGKQFILTYDVITTNGKTLALEQASSLSLNTSTTGINRKLYFTWDRVDNQLVIKRLTTGTDVTVDNVSVKEVSVGEIIGATWDDQQATIPQLGLMDWAKSTPVADELILIQDPNNTGFDILGNALTLIGSKNFNIPAGTITLTSGWVLNAGWSVEDDKAACDGNQSAESNIYQETVVGVGKTYVVTYTVTRSAGSVRVKVGSTGTGTYRDAAGTYTETITAAGDTTFYLNADADFIGTVDTITVKEVDPNDYWTLGTGWTIGVDKVSQSGSTSYLSYDGFTPNIGTKYEVVYTVSEYTSGSTSIDFAGSSLVLTESSLGTFTYDILATTTDKFQIKSIDFVGAIDSISIIPFTEDYFSSEFNGLPRIEPNGGWDVTPDDRLNSVKITYTAGPPEAGVIAPPLKQAMYLLLAHYYDNRSAVSFGNPKELPLGYKRIINNYKNPIWS
jgi:hypothetical protein